MQLLNPWTMVDAEDQRPSSSNGDVHLTTMIEGNANCVETSGRSVDQAGKTEPTTAVTRGDHIRLNMLIVGHYLLYVALVVWIVCADSWASLIMASTAVVLVPIAFACFRGCVWTRWEQAIHRTDWTIFDPMIRLARVPVTRESRVVLSMGTILGLYALIAVRTWLSPPASSASCIHAKP